MTPFFCKKKCQIKNTSKMHSKILFKENIPTYDFLFIGLGAANCLILNQLFEKNLLENKKIAIIEPDVENIINRTFCFWAEKSELQHLELTNFIEYHWDNIQINNWTEQSLKPLGYYHIPGIIIFEKVQSILDVINVTIFDCGYLGSPVSKGYFQKINIKEENVQSKIVFDNRPPKLSLPEKNESILWQSFLGWFIKTDKNHFDNSTATLMDFDLPQDDVCQFIYVLPFKPNYALIEITRFGKDKISTKDAESILKKYLSKKNIKYTINKTENGCIPMSTAQIDTTENQLNYIATGGRAGMLKPSTGYAFKSMAEHALNITESLINNKEVEKPIKNKRFQFYDRLLLKILENQPYEGKNIFNTLFKKIRTTEVLNFLEEKSTLRLEMKIFSKMPLLLFLKYAFKDIAYRISKVKPVILAFLFTIMSLVLSFLGLDIIYIVILGLLFISYGLSHGALDYLLDKNITSKTKLLKFIILYISKGLIYAFIWFLSADVALTFFILFSAFHFGQTDFKMWNISNNRHSFFWGLSVLLTILSFHFEETIEILHQIPGFHSISGLMKMQSSQILIIQVGSLAIGLFLSLIHRSKQMLITMSYLVISIFLPLLSSFGIYFIVQHSLHGWGDLKINLHISTNKMFYKAMPYNFGALILTPFIFYFFQENYFGIFFILLSCVSLPHVLAFNKYSTQIEQ